MKPSKINEKEMKVLLAQGKTVRQVAEYFHVTRPAIYNLLHKIGQVPCKLSVVYSPPSTVPTWEQVSDWILAQIKDAQELRRVRNQHAAELNDRAMEKKAGLPS